MGLWGLGAFQDTIVNRKATVLRLVSRSAEQTQRLGEYLGKLAQAGDVFLLVGELGSGKTCLAQGIARGLGVQQYVSSPSFVLIREHQGRVPFYHVDFYRLHRMDEIADLGLDDYFSGRGVCVVEWADRGMALLPEEHLLVTMEHVSEGERAITIEPRGERYVSMLSALNSMLEKEGWRGR